VENLAQDKDISGIVIATKAYSNRSGLPEDISAFLTPEELGGLRAGKVGLTFLLLQTGQGLQGFYAVTPGGQNLIRGTTVTLNPNGQEHHNTIMVCYGGPRCGDTVARSEERYWTRAELVKGT
jgi:hypothetical protein